MCCGVEKDGSLLICKCENELGIVETTAPHSPILSSFVMFQFHRLPLLARPFPFPFLLRESIFFAFGSGSTT